jgi:DME family drug/metabolite transporter
MQTAADLFLGITFGALSAVLFAIQNVIFKSQKHAITPTVANTIKMWVAFGFMSLIVIIPFRPAPTPLSLDAISILAISVLFGAAFGDLTYLTSQNRIGVSVAFPIAHSYPVLTYVFAVLALGEMFYIPRLIGIILAVSGIIAVSNEEDAGKEPDELRANGIDRLGLVLAVISSVLFATATLLIQVGMAGVDPIDGNLVRMFFGSLAMVPIFILARSRGMALPSKQATKIILLASFFGFSLASLFFVASIKYAGATLSAVVSSTAPIFALPLSFSRLKEHITPKVVIGTIVSVIGIALAIVGG